MAELPRLDQEDHAGRSAAIGLHIAGIAITVYIFLVWVHLLPDIGRWNLLSLAIGLGVLVLFFEPEVFRDMRGRVVSVAGMLLGVVLDSWRDPDAGPYIALAIAGYFTYKVLETGWHSPPTVVTELVEEEELLPDVGLEEFERACQLVHREFESRSRIPREDLLRSARQRGIGELAVLEAIAKYPVILHDPRDDCFWLDEVEPRPNWYEGYFDEELE